MARNVDRVMRRLLDTALRLQNTQMMDGLRHGQRGGGGHVVAVGVGGGGGLGKGNNRWPIGANGHICGHKGSTAAKRGKWRN